MTKKDIVLKISETTGLKQQEVKRIVQMTFDAIVDALSRGERVELRNFGIFKIKSRRPRTGRNPKTGVTVPIPSKKVAVFKPGMVMKQKVV